MALLSRYSTAVRSTVSPPPGSGFGNGGSQGLGECVDVAEIDFPGRDQMKDLVVAARGVQGELRGHQVILAER